MGSVSFGVCEEHKDTLEITVTVGEETSSIHLWTYEFKEAIDGLLHGREQPRE